MRMSPRIFWGIRRSTKTKYVIAGLYTCLLIWMIYQIIAHDDSLHNGAMKQACTLPQTDPFEAQAYTAFLKSVAAYKKENCLETHFKVFESSVDAESQQLWMHNNFKNFNLTQCSYRYFFWNIKNKTNIKFSKKVFNINEEFTEIPLEHEFISIKCTKESNTSRSIYKDMHAFVPLLNVPENRDNDEETTNPPNVVILLLESISRMSFIRMMPLTYAYLTKELDAIEIKGLAKLGDNTLTDVLPLLTNSSMSETKSHMGCVPTTSSPFDNCPFIWKDFKRRGYVTSFAEDLSSFNYLSREGFATKPTDSYLRPFFNAARKAKLMSEECIGSQNRLEFLLDYMKKVAVSSNLRKRLPYFQIIISGATCNPNVHRLRQDRYLKNFLQWFQQENFFNNTIFLLMSDHGSRWGEVHNSPQGFIESRMPFAFFLLPEWFQKKFPLAMVNMMGNRYRLTTPFDLYNTLKDILTFDTSLVDSKIQENTKKFNLNDDRNSYEKIPRGISLFLPIPLKRNCKISGIPGLDCVCNLNESTLLDTESEVVSFAANVAMKSINEKVPAFKNICVELQLERVKSAMLTKNEVDHSEIMNLIIVTQPGEASFEVTLTRKIEQGGHGTFIEIWKVDELIRRNTLLSTNLCIKP